jgi:hypothetical protein
VRCASEICISTANQIPLCRAASFCDDVSGFSQHGGNCTQPAVGFSLVGVLGGAAACRRGGWDGKAKAASAASGDGRAGKLGRGAVKGVAGQAGGGNAAVTLAAVFLIEGVTNRNLDEGSSGRVRSVILRVCLTP